MSNTIRPFEQRREGGTFGSQTATSSPVTHRGSVIGPTLVVKGEVCAEEDLLIMGRVEGIIDQNTALTIHGDGVVQASIRAKEITVEGTVEGNLYGTKRVKICETGRVTGNVCAPSVGLVEGASFKGMVDMEPDVAKIEDRFLDDVGRNEPDPADPMEASEPDQAAPPETDGQGDPETESEGETGIQAQAGTVGATEEASTETKPPARSKRRATRGSKSKSDGSDDSTDGDA